MKFRDYYEVLGVSRDASDAEIRKAFRKLARKYHPDVAEDKAAAEEKFKELNEAYEVLNDPEKRKKYDALGADWQHGGDFNPGAGSGFYDFGGGGGGSYRFGGTGFSDFFESMFGGTGGMGGFGGFGGGGHPQPQMRSRGRDIEADMMVTLEQVLHGAKRQVSLQEPARPGEPAGKPKKVIINIPKGVTEGQIIRCAGLGDPGFNGGENGDLLLRVRLALHPDYRVEGRDLIYDLRLAPWEAVLGGKVAVRSLHGELRLNVPPGTESGTEFRLKGKGLPGEGGSTPGDLYAIVSIHTPSAATEDEKELWQQLADKSGFDPR